MKTDPESHQRMTERRREGHEKKQASATVEKGLLIVNTGTGKGKTTAAFGMAVRVLGHGMRLGVVQFIKGALHTSERDQGGGEQQSAKRDLRGQQDVPRCGPAE